MNRTGPTLRSLDIQIRRPPSLTSVVLEELERMILSGELSPGEPINEKALAERMSVSRGPIREACRRLEQAGLVEIIVNRGVFVRKLSPEDAAELCDIRAVLSGYAGRLLAKHVTADQMTELTEAVLRMEALAEKGDVGGFYTLNAAFHETLFEFAGNARLARMYAALSKELHLFRWRALMISANLGKSVTEHREILAALETRHAARAAKAMEMHAISVKTRLIGSGLGD